jgi:hypothetical protein
MATARKPPSRTSHIKHVTRVRGSVKEHKERLKADIERRATSSTLLSPGDVSGEYDASRGLFTTLGGQARPLTMEDLAQFRAYVKTAGKKYKKGITAQQVINHSRPEDREKANKEIHLAVPAGTNRNVMRFITNAGPDSNFTRHHVTIELLDFDAATARPEASEKAAYWLVRNTRLRIECGCPRFRFWYRYIATIGGYNLNINEPSFPKIRNPKLTGVACKHLLRVMTVLLRDMSIRSLVGRMIDKGRQDVERFHQQVTKTEAEEIAKKQAARPKEIKVTKETKSAKKLKTAVAKAKPAAQTEAKPGAAENPARAKAKADKAAAAAERSVRKLHELGQLSKDQLDLILKTISKG